MSPQTPPLDRRDLYKDRRHDRPPPVSASSDASRYSSYSSSSRDFSRRPPSGYYRNYQEDSGSRGGTPSRSDRFYYEEQQQQQHGSYHHHRGYSGNRYERGRPSNRDRSFRRSPRYDPYHQYQRRSSPNYEPYHHHSEYQRRSSPNYEPYHHDSYPSDHRQHHHHQANLRSVAVPIASSRLNSDEYYYRRQSLERRSDWERERQSSERRSDWERERERERDREKDRDRDRKREDGPARWSRAGRENPDFKNQELENPGKRIPDFKNQEEDIPMKKARLGWGQGLAKYEKQKVGDPIEPSNSKGVFGNNDTVELERERELERENEKEREMEKDSDGLENGEIRCEDVEKDEVSCQAVIGLEAMSCQPLIGREEDSITREVIPVSENEEKSSLKTEDKECGEIVETENKECGEIVEIPILPLPNLDISDGNSNFALASFLTNHVLPAGQSSLNQLSELKEDISKQLEVTETEIDLLETELKSFDSSNDNINDINIIPAHELVINDDLPKPGSEERETKTEIIPVEKISIEYDTKTLLNAQQNPNLIPQIRASNSESSNKANSIFTPGLINPNPPHQQFEILVNSIKSQTEKETRIKERIKAQKKETKLKEMILARKFRIFRRIWKEELKLIPDKKSRKSNCRDRNSVNRNRYFSSTGNLTPLGTKKAFDFSKLLMSSSQSPSKLYRPHLKMPSLILSQNERNNSKFLSSNGLVFDPVADQKSKSKSNPWTESEKETFLEMLCKFGKDFTKIATFLPHKSTADCVEFYYKNHKSEGFCEKMKRFSVENVWGDEKLKKKEETKTLITGGSSDYLGNSNNNNNNNRKRKREINAVSVENLPKNNSRNNNLNKKKRATADLPVQVKIKSNASEFRKRVNSSKKTKNADLAISLPPKPNPNPNSSSSPDLTKSSEGGVSSCITNAINYPNPNFDENNYEYCSDDGWREVESNEWTEEEKKLFVKGLAIYGKDFVKISACVGTRNTEQCKVFFSKSWKCLSLEAGFPVNGNTVSGNPGVGNPGIGIPDLKGSSSDEVEKEEKVSGDVKIFGRIIACQNGNNDEIKDAIISVLKDGNENEENKEGGIENMPDLECEEKLE